MTHNLYPDFQGGIVYLGYSTCRLLLNKSRFHSVSYFVESGCCTIANSALWFLLTRPDGEALKNNVTTVSWLSTNLYFDISTVKLESETNDSSQFARFAAHQAKKLQESIL